MTQNGEVGSPEPSKSGSNNPIKLHSGDHGEILDVIDQLRSEGLSKYISLPQLIVCGDQSSGKSSVLEAISGLSFPTKDNVCTRFTTELILRRDAGSSVTVSILPDDDRTSAEKERLRQFRSPTLTLDCFGEIVDKAGEVMGVKKDGLSFSKDVLRVEVLGPTQPHLTLVDLPGLYHAPDESQDEEGVQFVESLVLSYMVNPRSIMLAVISGKSDIALQKVTSFTRKLDPKGERTMGIITKPDTIPGGSDMEQSFCKLALNKRMPFRLGWHVIKNRSFEERHFTQKQRDQSEAEFFLGGVWSSIPRVNVGIDSLRPRLSLIQKHHTISQMSGFIAESQSLLDDAERSLEKLGEPRQTPSQQRQYLLYSSERFNSIISAAVDGVYSDSFFGDAMADDGYRRRIRAIIQNSLSDFSDVMTEKGEDRRIVADDSEIVDGRPCVTRSDLVKEVRSRLRRSRGRELPGTFNPLIIGDLFFMHSRPWQALVDRNVELILRDIDRALVYALRETLDDQCAEKLLKHVVNPRLAEIKKGLRTKVAELLKPHRSGHPITYDHDFAEIMRAIRRQHHRDAVTKRLKKFFGKNYTDDTSLVEQYSFSMEALIETLVNRQDAGTEELACSEAIDCMLAYYKVARERFVDDFSSLAIEKCLLQPLLTLYCPMTVLKMTDDVVSEIANEDESITKERDRLTEKVTVLQRCLKELHRLDLHGLTEPAPPQELNLREESDEAVIYDEEPEVIEDVVAPSPSPSPVSVPVVEPVPWSFWARESVDTSHQVDPFEAKETEINMNDGRSRLAKIKKKKKHSMS